MALTFVSHQESAPSRQLQILHDKISQHSSLVHACE